MTNADFPGPVHRELFFSAQARQRRASRWFGAIALVAALATGIPLGIAVAPVLYIAIYPIATVMLAVFPKSIVWSLLRHAVPGVLLGIAFLLFAGANFNYTVRQSATDPSMFEMHGEARVGADQPASPDPWKGPVVQTGAIPGAAIAAVLITLFLVLPGGMALLLTWYFVRRVFRSSGVAGVLQALGARAPDINRTNEKILVNTVQEMAIAASLPPLRVMVMDRAMSGDAANAAALGWSIDDTTILVTPGLIENLPRDQMQAIVARLVAAVGNGDAHVAMQLLALFETIEIVRMILRGHQRWAALRTLANLVGHGMRLALRGDTEREHPACENAVMALVARTGQLLYSPVAAKQPAAHADIRSSGQGIVQEKLKRLLRFVLTPIRIPLNWMAFTIWLTVTLSAWFFAGPILGAMWRRRQLLADAMAVQLTRDPNALAGAIARLDHMGVAFPAAATMSFLFASWSDSPTSIASADATPKLTALAHYMNVDSGTRIVALNAMGAKAQSDTGAPAHDPFGPPVVDAPIRIAAIAALVPLGFGVLALVLVVDFFFMGVTLAATGGLLSLLPSISN